MNKCLGTLEFGVICEALRLSFEQNLSFLMRRKRKETKESSGLTLYRSSTFFQGDI